MTRVGFLPQGLVRYNQVALRVALRAALALVVGLHLGQGYGFAQRADTSDYYAHWYDRVLPPPYKPRKLALNLRLDIRHSFVSDKPIIVNGFNAGISITPRHEVGLGVYWMTNASRDKFATQVLNKGRIVNREDSTSSESNLQFGSIFYRFSFFRNRWFDFSIPIEVGLGHIWTTTWNSKNQQTGGAVGNWIVPVQAGAYLEFKATRWLGAMTTAGYRITLPNTVAKQDYDGLYYSYGVKIYLGYIIRDLGINKIKVTWPSSAGR